MMGHSDSNLLFGGVDVGAYSIQAVVVNGQGVAGRSSITTSDESEEGAQRALKLAMQPLGKPLEDLHTVIATGAGRNDVGFAARVVSDGRCLTEAAAYLFPEVGTVIDVGAEGYRVHKLDARGRLLKSLANDRCASGAGIFLDEMATALEVDLKEAVELGSSAARSEPIESLCVVFAESEVISAVHRQVPKDEILAGVQEAIADKVAALTRRIRPRPALMFTGGGGLNSCLVRMLEEKLGEQLHVPTHPETIGALGASLLAMHKFQSSKEQR